MPLPSPIERFKDLINQGKFTPVRNKGIVEQVVQPIKKARQLFAPLGKAITRANHTAVGNLFKLNEECLKATAPLRQKLNEIILPFRSKATLEHLDGSNQIIKENHFGNFVTERFRSLTPDIENLTQRADRMKKICPTSPAGWIAESMIHQSTGNKQAALDASLTAYHKMLKDPTHKPSFRELTLQQLEESYRDMNRPDKARHINFQRDNLSSKFLGSPVTGVGMSSARLNHRIIRLSPDQINLIVKGKEKPKDLDTDSIDR